MSKAAPKPSKSAEVMVGEVTHFFPKIVVCVVKMNHGTLSVGDQVRIGGKSKDFIQKVNSIQIESVDVKTAKKGQLIGLKVNREVNVGDKLYRLP